MFYILLLCYDYMNKIYISCLNSTIDDDEY